MSYSEVRPPDVDIFTTQPVPDTSQPLGEDASLNLSIFL